MFPGSYHPSFDKGNSDYRTAQRAQAQSAISALYIDLERYSRAYPQENKEIEETYRLLNKKCLEAMAECD